MDVVVREFDAVEDCAEVEKLERRCEVGSNSGSSKVSLFSDLMGDPLCRVRHCPAYIMLVAVCENKIVGLIRGCIKTVSCGRPIQALNGADSEKAPLCVRAAYILGLRVSPEHRRKGIGLKLVRSLEDWFRNTGADYAYMATEKDNGASIKLFTEKCSYRKFRTPALLGHPVHAHAKKLKPDIKIQKLDAKQAEYLYRSTLGDREFFPQDIDAVLQNRLSLGTWVAYPKNQEWPCSNDISSADWNDGTISALPASWAIVSVWNSSDLFKLQVKLRGIVWKLKYLCSSTSRILDRMLPCLRIPSVPDVFRPFGVQFLYGLHAQGPQAEKLVPELFWFVHNMARKSHGCCRLLATEVGACDPVRPLVPHWHRFSCTDDIWCIKNLSENSAAAAWDWTASASGLPLFVDPRDF